MNLYRHENENISLVEREREREREREKDNVTQVHHVTREKTVCTRASTKKHNSPTP